MQKRKVLFVVHQMNHGGVQKATIAALNAIDYSENEVTLYVRKNRIELLKDINPQVNKIIINEDRTSYYRRPLAIFWTLCEVVSKVLEMTKAENNFHHKLNNYIVRTQMKKEQELYFKNVEAYDVAISYIQGYTAQFVAEYVTARKKIMFYHGSMDELHEIHEKIMASYDGIVGVNAGVKDVLCSNYPQFSKKITYIENYVDAQEIQKKSMLYQVQKFDEKKILCTCGRLSKEKGIDLAVKTGYILKENGVPFHWYFVGDGPERENVEYLIREYELDNYITITGMLDNPYPYIAGCDIYVQTSYEEAHPLAILEAVMLGTPVITTETIGGKTIVQQGINGLIANISSDKLATCIIELITNNKLYNDIINKLKEKDYSGDWEIYQKKWNELLEE